MRIRSEVTPFLLAAFGVGAVCAASCALAGIGFGAAVVGAGVALALGGFCVFFFRDPDRTPPADEDAIVSGADGVVAQIVEMPEREFLKIDAVRISVFLSPMNVHVNRAPMAGRVTFAQYYPGRKCPAMKPEASDANQHSSILIAGKRTTCLVNQIVGAVARRVIFWVTVGQDLAKGERIGMMKFGSRLDVYFPVADVTVAVKVGDNVVAGETVMARFRKGGNL